MSSGSHLSKELLDLVKSIGESRSKQEEDKIITAEAQILKQKFLERNLNEKKMRELLIRAIYVEMLGHDASFAHIHAVNLTQSKNLLVKRIGYLACSLFIDENSELLILMICTIQRDLQSKNHLEVLAALTVLGKLCNQHILMAVYEAVQKLLSHAHEMIRKKSVMVMNKMHKSFPTVIEQMDLKMKKALCDKDPSVMAVTLNYFSDQVKQRPGDFKDLVNSFVVILKQVVEHRLPRDYDYHRIPAPWIQIKILEILAYLGADDKVASEQMYEMLSQVLKRGDDAGINIGYALVYQCLKCITMIFPSQSLIDAASNTVSRFLSSESHNLKYIGITGLAAIVKIDAKYTLSYQSLVVDCLEDADDTLKIKTLDLLFRMTNKQNVEAIVEKLLSYLKEAPIESSVRKDLVIKINTLCEEYSPSKNWYVRTMNKLYEMGGDLITADLSNKFIQSISEYEKEIDGEKFRDSTISIYLKILKKNPKIPDSMMQVIAWIVGEYASTLTDQKKLTKILDHLSQAAYRTLEDELTRGYILTAITKIHSALNFAENPSVETVMNDYYHSKHLDVQQRAIEYRQFKICSSRLPKDLLMNTPLNEDQMATQSFDFDLTFLDSYVQTKISEGAKQYDPKKRQIDPTGYEMVATNFSKEKGLNYKPYETPSYSRTSNADQQQNNPLFQAPVEKLNPNSLQIQGVKQIWGPTAQAQPQPTGGTAENYYQSQNNLKIVQSQMEGATGQEPSGSFSSKSNTKQQQQQQQDKKQQLKANPLFAGIGGEKKKDSEDDSDDESSKKKKKKDKKKKEEEKDDSSISIEMTNVSTGNDIMNLLDLDQPGTAGNLLSTESVNLQTKGSILDDDIFGSGPTHMSSSQINIKHFTPLQITTQQFGEMWLSTQIEKKIVVTSQIIMNPQIFASTIRTKLDINPVEIIGNEVICAGQLIQNGGIHLVHCRLNQSGPHEFTVKGSSIESVDLLVSLLPALMSPSF